MRGSAHIGITALVVLGANPPMTIPFIIGAWCGSTLPDCDLLGTTFSLFVPAWLFTKHRQHIHSFAFMLIFSGLAAVVDVGFGIGIAIGYFLHLCMDALTPMHLPKAWWPLKR